MTRVCLGRQRDECIQAWNAWQVVKSNLHILFKIRKKTGERKREEWKTNSDNVTQSSILLHKLAMWQTAREIVFSIKQYLVVGGWVWIRNRRKLQCMWRKERWSERERKKIREKIIFVQVVVSIGDTMTSIDSDKISIQLKQTRTKHTLFVDVHWKTSERKKADIFSGKQSISTVDPENIAISCTVIMSNEKHQINHESEQKSSFSFRS